MIDINRFYLAKESLRCNFHGIDLSRVIIFELAEIVDPEKKLLPFWKYLKRYLVHSLDLNRLKVDKITATFGIQNRKDHKEIFDYIVAKLDNSVAVNDLKDYDGKIVFHPLVFFRVLCQVLLSLNKISFISLTNKVRLASACTYYCNSLLELEKIDLCQIKKYLSMYNSTQHENLITQYMKLHGIPTYSLCEGVYMIEEERPNLDTVNYRNLETDYLISWGKCVVDDFTKYGINPKRLLIGGYPRDAHPIRFDINSKMKKCVVLLARNTYYKSDLCLLKLLSSYSNNYDISLKLHPDNDLEEFANYAKENNMTIIPRTVTISQCLNQNNYDFAIAVNTTAYYESLMSGVPCMRFYDKSYSLMHGYQDFFETNKEFELIISKIASELKTGVYQDSIDKILEYVIGLGIDNYRQILLG